MSMPTLTPPSQVSYKSGGVVLACFIFLLLFVFKVVFSGLTLLPNVTAEVTTKETSPALFLCFHHPLRLAPDIEAGLSRVAPATLHWFC